MKYLLTIALLLSSTAYSQTSYRLLEPDALSIEYEAFKFLRDPYMPQYTGGYGDSNDGENEHWAYGAALDWHVCLVCVKKDGNTWKSFWRNRVPMRATNKQVRYVGWHWELGAELWPGWRKPDGRTYGKVEVFSRHFSQHVMEDEGSGRFPLQDSYVIKFKFLGD